MTFYLLRSHDTDITDSYNPLGASQHDDITGSEMSDSSSLSVHERHQLRAVDAVTTIPAVPNSSINPPRPMGVNASPVQDHNKKKEQLTSKSSFSLRPDNNVYTAPKNTITNSKLQNTISNYKNPLEASIGAYDFDTDLLNAYDNETYKLKQPVVSQIMKEPAVLSVDTKRSRRRNKIHSSRHVSDISDLSSGMFQLFRMSPLYIYILFLSLCLPTYEFIIYLHFHVYYIEV